MKIAVDIDDVVANFMETFLVYYNLKMGKSVRIEEVKNYDCRVLMEDRVEFVKFVRGFFESEYFAGVGLERGAFEGINFLDDNHDVIFITSRPEDYAEGTKAFFKKYFPERDFEILFVGGNDFKGDKGAVCKRLGIDLIIDDSFENCADCVGVGVR